MTTLAKWSVEDYHHMIAAGILRDRRVELLAGDIVQMSPEVPLHASRIRKIANYLRSLLKGLALVSEAHRSPLFKLSSILSPILLTLKGYNSVVKC
jgi:Uma2 family endonuclease